MTRLKGDHPLEDLAIAKLGKQIFKDISDRIQELSRYDHPAELADK
jgi:hypothetical protein